MGRVGRNNMPKTRTSPAVRKAKSDREAGSTPLRAPQTPPEARRLLNRAAIVHDEAERYPGLYNEQELLEADSFEATALAYLYPETEPLVREGAALVPQEGSASTASAIRRSPKIAALADNERLDLASEARADELAIDMEESAAAETSIEKAMTHQMAAAHATALRVIGRVNLEIESMGTRSRNEQREAMVEIARLSNAASRLMQTYQQAALTLVKVRSGGRQTVVVQYVHVNEGGQAVITGAGRGIG
jgi:hypothetical protein